MRLAPPELIQGFEQSPIGSRIWISGLGRSLAPLLRSGDALQFERCNETQLRPGDVALARRGTDVIAHVVLEIRPLTMSNLRGRRDEGELELLGRAVSIRRSGRVFKVSRWARALVLGLVRAASSESLAAAYRSGRDLALGRRTRSLRRRWLGPLDVRRVIVDDTPQLLRFVGDNANAYPSFLLEQLEGRWGAAAHAFGAFTSGGAMVGFCFIDEYRQESVALEGEWVRYLVVDPVARHLGLAQRLVSAAADAARERGLIQVHADVRATNAASVRVFRALGFEVDPALSAQTDAAHHAAAGTFLALTLKL